MQSSKKILALISSVLLLGLPVNNLSASATFKRGIPITRPKKRVKSVVSRRKVKQKTSKSTIISTYSKLFGHVIKASNDIICGTSEESDFSKIPYLTKINNCFCSVFGIVCAEDDFTNLEATDFHTSDSFTGFLNFETIDFTETYIPEEIGYGKLRPKIQKALDQTNLALDIIGTRYLIIKKSVAVKQITTLLRSIRAALDAILYPDKYDLSGDVSE